MNAGLGVIVGDLGFLVVFAFHEGGDLLQIDDIMTGREWIIDAVGGKSASLADMATMRGLCERIVADLNLQVVGQPMWQKFPPPGGVPGLYLLTESHLACHTFRHEMIAPAAMASSDHVNLRFDDVRLAATAVSRSNPRISTSRR